MARRIAPRRARLERVAGRLSPQPIVVRIARCNERVEVLAARARRSVLARVADHRRHLDGCGKLLASLSYHGVLQRGYALVRDSEGRTLRSTAQVAAGQLLDIELADGHVDAQALSGGAQGRRQAAAARAHRVAPEERSPEAEARGRCSDAAASVSPRCFASPHWRAQGAICMLRGRSDPRGPRLHENESV